MNHSFLVPGVALVCVLLSGTATPGPRDLLEPETAELLVDLVRASAEYDLYFARCRGDISGRRTDNVKKVLINKYGMTVTQVQDDYFPERSYQAARKNLEKDFLRQISRLGGCKGAKKAGFQDRLRARYQGLLEQLRQLP
jgi:hypothetical protein